MIGAPVFVGAAAVGLVIALALSSRSDDGTAPRSAASATASRSPTRTPTPRARSAACSNCPAARADASTATSPIPPGSRIDSRRRSPPTSRTEAERNGASATPAGRPHRSDDGAKEERRRERERHYEARVAARSRNLDLGAALARWQPKLDTDAVKLLGQIVLAAPRRAAAWAHRLCVDQPATTNKQGRETVRYPRGARGREGAPRGGARRPPARTGRPKHALAVVLRLLVAQRLADTDGLPNADRQGIYEPELLATSELLGKLARRVAPASVRRHLAEQQTSDRREDTEEALDEAA